MSATCRVGISFDAAIGLIRGFTGIDLPETKHRGLRDYLAGLPDGMSIADLERALRLDEGERERFLSMATINETYFFREQRHFRILRSSIFPELAARAGRILVLSAACSTGEEAYSLAALGRSFVEPDRLAVYAGDISPVALARGVEGRYGPNSFRDDGREFAGALERFTVKEGRETVITEDLKRDVRFVPLNLADADYPAVPEGLGLAFLRNALMYMPMETRMSIAGRIASKLRDGGYLFFSSSEIPHLSHPDLVLVEDGGVFYFRKKSALEKCHGSRVTSATFIDPPPRREPGLEPGLEPTAEPVAEPASIGVGAGRRTTGTIAVDPDEVAIYATQRLNNPLFDEPGVPAFQAALRYLESVYLLGSGGDASEAVSSAEKEWGVNALSRFIAAMAAPSDESQEATLREALRLEPCFWPARLRLAMTLAERRASNGTERRRGDSSVRAVAEEFGRCASDIERYLAAGRFEYQFILDGFNAKYFLDLCRGWVRKLGTEGASNGPR